MGFEEKLEKIIKKNNSLVSVGLDSDFERIPLSFKKQKNPIFEFNKSIINKTADLVCAYKPNLAFYEAYGLEGIKQLKLTFDYLKKEFPNIVTILDAKWADIGSTNQGYVEFVFDYLGADGVTVNPYLGREALEPFLQRKEKGIFVLCRTSNLGAGEFQDLMIHLNYGRFKDATPLYQIVAFEVVKKWNKNNNCLLVVGATYPDELKKVREIVGEEMWILVPGVGAQGGDLEATLKAGLNKKGKGLIINSSRGIIFSKNPQKETEDLRDKINRFRKKSFLFTLGVK